MKTEDVSLKIQACVDGEASAAERSEIERRIAANPAERQLAEGLKAVSALLKANEPVAAVPETREFYFSKIARQIEAEKRKAERVPVENTASWFQWARKHFVGLAGSGFAALLALALFAMPGGVGAREGEVDLASDEMGSYTYRDQQQEVTMVWLYDRKTAEPEPAEAIKLDTSTRP